MGEAYWCKKIVQGSAWGLVEIDGDHDETPCKDCVPLDEFVESLQSRLDEAEKIIRMSGLSATDNSFTPKQRKVIAALQDNNGGEG